MGPRAQRSLFCAAAGAVALLLVAGCSNEKPHQTVPLVHSGLVDIGPAAAYPAGTASTKYLAMYGIVLVNDSGPVIAIRPSCADGTAMATWDADHHKFVCAADGSEYDILGRPIKGPATRPLPAEPTVTNPDGTLSVDLDKLYALPAAKLPANSGN